MDINNEWEKFCEDDNNNNNNDGGQQHIEQQQQQFDRGLRNNDMNNDMNNDNNNDISNEKSKPIPLPTELYISTKTKIAYLNIPIDIKNVFWKIPIMTYGKPGIGVVKKQMKFISINQEELDDIIKKKEKYEYVDELVISQIIKPDGRIKFRDIRKVSIGLCRKDITSYRCKKKSAFMNCFVVILRLFYNDEYKEIHVKVFNTGKLEIPGIQTHDILHQVLTLLIEILTPIVDTDPTVPLCFLENKSETVLINSNFSCGYYINREKLYERLKYKYKINSAYDPCSYPGIQCEFYYNQDLQIQTGVQPPTLTISDEDEADDTDVPPIISGNETTFYKVSFMIFRTGSVLIVGKCSENILYKIYDFLCNILKEEYSNVGGVLVDTVAVKNEIHNKKLRKIRKKITLL
jgi:hypothetical protein